MNTQAELFAAALGLSAPWIIKKVNLDLAAKRLDIEVDFERGSRFSYKEGESLFTDLGAYDTSTKRWRHLNFFQYQCFIEARVPRVKLPNGGIHQIKVPWEGKHSGFTLMFEAFVMLLIKQQPVHQVVEMLGGYDAKIWQMLDYYISESVDNQELSDLTMIGIDETSIGRGEFITLFVDLKTHRTVFVTQGKDNQSVKEFVDFLIAHNGNPKKIEVVSCDMSKAYILGVNTYLKDAEIVFDKFHIIKLLNAAVDQVRRTEVKAHPILKNSRYVFLKNAQNRTSSQQAKLELIEAENYMLKTYQAMRLRETFQAIYKCQSERAFYAGILDWFKQVEKAAIAPLTKAKKTIKEHLGGIVTWAEHKVNNAILEGINSMFKAALAKARGYKTFKNARNMVYLLSGKFNLIPLEA